MKIIINDIAASTGGALSILQDFYQTIKTYDSENEYIFLLSDAYIEETDNIKIKLFPKVKKSGLRKLFFDCVIGKRVINGLRPDIVLSLQNIITFGVKCPQIVYIHQPIPYQKEKQFSLLKKEERIYAVYQKIIGLLIDKSARGADKVIVQTKWMQKAVCERAKVDISKIIQIMPDIMDIETKSGREKPNSRKFFYPTGEVLYKNISCIEKACAILRDWKIWDFQVVLTTEKSEDKNIKCIGYVSREEVFQWYQKSTLLFPSYIETFGMPLAEMRKMAGVVLAADCEYSREVLDGYVNAYYFNYNSPEELASLMKKVIKGDISVNQGDIVEGGCNAPNSWERVLEVMLCYVDSGL